MHLSMRYKFSFPHIVFVTVFEEAKCQTLQWLVSTHSVWEPLCDAGASKASWLFGSKFFECPHSSISRMLVWKPPPPPKWKFGHDLALGISPEGLGTYVTGKFLILFMPVLYKCLANVFGVLNSCLQSLHNGWWML